ncbi:unnamed protein product [Rotaria sordida]|uniref:RabBD domain-containing protein n=1 Tax=Rotaria sordida TaxID=392033 RepID=A0A815EBY5_9BILA|nr:unnamed protein product [Rotaria sordida]CAF1309567.1 unnamed protein product [Rotaria sordida]CAF1310372.1 unnamed protein product [Rotaria sordida]
MSMKESVNDRFVCPNDRQLELRSKINSGWSFRTNHLPSNYLFNKISQSVNNKSLTDEEIEEIEKVLKRAQRIEIVEEERIRKLIDHFDNIKKCATGNGSSQCVLCRDQYHLLNRSFNKCFHCHKSVCNKCSIKIDFNDKLLSLCKICSEYRQLWKKSGAWFYGILPRRSTIKSSSSLPSSEYIRKNNRQSISDQTSSDDDDQRISDRFNKEYSSKNILFK